MNNLTTLTLKELLIERAKLEQEFTNELEERAKKLMEILPDSLRKNFSVNHMWIQDIYKQTLLGECLVNNIDDFTAHGFTSKEDAMKALQSLKDAWSAQVDVTIKEENNRIRIEYRII